MVVMSVKRQDEALKDLAEAIGNVRIPDAPAIRRAIVEPYVDAEGDPALKALIIVDAPDEEGWSADFTHALRKRVNRLAAERQLEEHVYVVLFTQDEFDTRENAEDPVEGNSTSAIDQALIRQP